MVGSMYKSFLAKKSNNFEKFTQTDSKLKGISRKRIKY